MAPHDLRRTCAKLLKEARSPEGGDIFEVDDIRVVLGHARIDTTQRYLENASAEVLCRAAPALDLDVRAAGAARRA